MSGFFFKAVVQAVLLFGAETWVVTPRMGQFLGGFQDLVVRQLTAKVRLKVRVKLCVGDKREDAGYEPMGNLHSAKAEYVRAVYCDATDN